MDLIDGGEDGLHDRLGCFMQVLAVFARMWLDLEQIVGDELGVTNTNI